MVRNSSRILTASLPFCRSGDLADVTCNHGVRGPPLEPYLFDNCGSNAAARYTNYVEGIMHGIEHMAKTFPGAEIHDNLVILVPSAEFKDAVLPMLNTAAAKRLPAPGISMVDAVVGAFAQAKKNAREPSRIVLDTLESFDGMERLFVFAVGLDSGKTVEGCCGVYRAITRAHMFVCVVQEHLQGGWLEFMGAVKRDASAEFDEDQERERVDPRNITKRLSMLSSTDGAPEISDSAVADLSDATVADLPDATATVADLPDATVTVSDHPVDVSGGDGNDSDGSSDDDGRRLAAYKEEEKKKKKKNAKATSMVIVQNVWGLNLNAPDFAATISTLSFNPLPNEPTAFMLGWNELIYGRADVAGHLAILDSVTHIEAEAFQNCLGIISVTIPQGVKSIGARTFRGCNRLTSMVIANSVMFIGGAAFSGCFGLTAVTAPAALKEEIESKQVFKQGEECAELRLIFRLPVFEFKYERLPGRKGSRIFKLKYVHMRFIMTGSFAVFSLLVFSIPSFSRRHVYACVCVSRRKWVGACTNERFV